MRLFVAVELEEEVVDRVAGLLKELREEMPDIRWARRESLHLTLKFLGEVDEGRREDLCAALQAAAGSLEGPFRVEVEGLGTFGDRKRPRVVWAGVHERSGALVALRDAVEGAAAAQGFEKQSRPFRPHLTLARLKTSSPRLGRALASRSASRMGVSTVSSITLMQSRLKPEGAAYTALERFALGPDGDGTGGIPVTGPAVILASYLVGGIPFGYLFYQWAHGRDIRGVGSGNTGATNMVRAAGWKLGVLVLLLDAAKGAAAVELGLRLTGSAGWGAAAGTAAVAGHCFPVWLGFRGGKGVATGCGAFLVIHPAGMGLALGVFALTLAATRMVAAGSMLASVSFPLAAASLGAAPAAALWSGGACLLIIVRHHENVRRILRGEEGRMFGADRGKGTR